MRRPLRYSARWPAELGIVRLESESYYAASPEETTLVDFLIHKPGIGCI